MESLPALDPIPLPAPVWIFVALHTLTLILHFVSLQLLVGGLAFATIWGWYGRRRSDERLTEASKLVGRKLPIVMTYVINLGVPPLLFAQVLYGRALYTSSILIGLWWIGVIFLLMAGYSALYLMIRGYDSGRGVTAVGVAGLLVVLMIGMVYSTNMSLMLRPDTWATIYRESPTGTSFHTGDHAVFPRWLFMMLGGGVAGGAGLLLLALVKDRSEDLRAFLNRWGGRCVTIFAALQIVVGLWAYKAQPEAVRALYSDLLFYKICAAAWLLSAVGLVALGVAVSRRPAPTPGLTAAVAGVGFLAVTLVALVRDGIRYAALRAAGFDIWDRAVSTNASTVILFLVCFVAALAVVGWLARVVIRARPVAEPYV